MKEKRLLLLKKICAMKEKRLLLLDKLVDKILKVFVLAFTDEQLKKISDKPFLEKINLSNLDIGEYQDNRLCEARIHLSDIPKKIDAEYVGFCSWRFDKKSWQRGFRENRQENLNRLELSPNVVWCGWTTHDWLGHSSRCNAGISTYLTELINYTKLPVSGRSLYANTFICHKSVYLEFQKFFFTTFQHFHKKYGFDYRFRVSQPEHNGLQSAIFYEHITCLYFSNRSDLILQIIP